MMIRSFKKNNNPKGLITGVILVTAAIGAAAYLFLSKNRASVRQQLSGYLKSLNNGDTGENRSDVKPPRDYLSHKMKSPKTDRENLLKHHILTHEPNDLHETKNQDAAGAGDGEPESSAFNF